MKKMPCLFKRDFSNPRNPILLPEVHPGCEWVLAGEGIATQKFDGTACLIDQGRLFARFDVKIDPRTGKRKKFPEGTLIPCDPEPDPVTGHWPHWIMVTDPPQPQYKYHWDALKKTLLFEEGLHLTDGTYEACGPHFQSNPERFEFDRLIKHGSVLVPLPLRSFDAIRDYLKTVDIEGIVFHRLDDAGTMCKIRKGDYGMGRKP